MRIDMPGKILGFIRLGGLALTLATLAACGAMAPGTGQPTIEGSVWYRERIAPPPGAVIRVTLENVAKMDVPAELIAETSFTPEGGPPWTFVLAYDSAKINAQGQYALRAQLRSGGRLMFTSTETIPAFGDAMPRIMMSMTGGRQARAAAGIPDAGLTETYWKLTSIKGTPAQPGGDGRELNMVLTDAGTRVKGYSGCNSFTGSYTTYNDSIEFFEMASTMMACQAGEQQETRFLQALRKTRLFQIIGDQLRLTDADGQALLEFVAVDRP